MRRFASTGELIWSLKHRSLYFSPDVRVMIHSRILQPFGPHAFVSRPAAGSARDNRNVFVAIGMCIALVAVFFIVSIGCQQLGAEYVDQSRAGGRRR